MLLFVILALLLVVWGLAWQSQPQLAFGILLGLGVAWLLVNASTPYLTGVEEMPVWLPPLPLATVAIALLVYGIVIWFREETPVEKPKADTHDHHH